MIVALLLAALPLFAKEFVQQPVAGRIHVSVRSPDDYAVVARRKGEVWQVGAITDWMPRTIELDTAFLGAGTWEAEIFADAPDAEVEATHYVRSLRCITAGERLPLKLAPGGGWTARFRQVKPLAATSDRR